MDIERLNKSQIVMLTLLVSFVTSIATGIVTVSLMDQAPPAIAQTVNRIVERTVEKVVPAEMTSAAATTVTTEKTIVVKESDLIAQGLQKVTPSIVRLFTPGIADGKDIEIFLGLGIVTSESGTLLTDIASLPSGALIVLLPDGKKVSASVVSRDPKTGLALMQGATSTSDGAITWTPATFRESVPALGTSVVGISGKLATRIGNGIVTAVSEGEARLVETNVPSGAIAYGSALVNVDGTIEGISTVVSRAASENTFLASESIMVYTKGTQTPAAGTSTN